ncbi:MAG: RNA-binding S4 domain-containing protein [Bacteriovoracaceae bacterium]|nr:RNA-binding S4 domain-containing protein [Bacteriovoracaceae bacterium]
MLELKLKDAEFIPLCDLLKTTGLCESGGEGKAVVAEGLVLVDGQIETRKRCKIRSGQVVEYNGQQIIVS